MGFSMKLSIATEEDVKRYIRVVTFYKAYQRWIYEKNWYDPDNDFIGLYHAEWRARGNVDTEKVACWRNKYSLHWCFRTLTEGHRFYEDDDSGIIIFDEGFYPRQDDALVKELREADDWHNYPVSQETYGPLPKGQFYVYTYG